MRKIVYILCVLVIFFNVVFFVSCADNRHIDRCLLQIEYQNGVVSGSVEYCFILKSTDNKVLFNLYANQMSEGQNISIKRVTSEECPCDFELLENSAYLQVALPQTIDVGDEVSLRVDFETIIPPSLSRLGRGDITVNLAYFYPVVFER